MPAPPRSSQRPLPANTLPADAERSNERRDTFLQWAERHDREPNPVIDLARRMMEPVLSDVRDKVVIDIGCGTGHDLELAISKGAKAIGIDFTREVLDVAAKRRAIAARLIQADAHYLPLQEASADLIVCSFVLSYLQDVNQLAEQLAKIAVPGADVYLVDMHPEAQRLGWRAALNPNLNDDAVIHELTTLRQAFDTAGFELQSLLEPRLGHPERRLFETVVRPDLYDNARHMPALYLFHFQRRVLTADRKRPIVIPRNRPRTWHVTGARLALGPHTAVQADLIMDADRIRGIYDRPSRRRPLPAQRDVAVDLTGLLLLPGLINAHDHLQAGWPVRVPKQSLAWLGALRNLISGVTTVFHDDADKTAITKEFPVRLVRNCVRTSADDIRQIAAEFEDAPDDAPFVIDLGCCGTESSDFVSELDRRGLLTDRTILVGVAELETSSRMLLQSKGTAVVWTPTSGVMSDQFATTNHLAALGTGESGKTNIGDEIRAAAKLGVPPEAIYSMLTSRPASILRLRNGEGRIVAGMPADMIAVADTGSTPAEALCSLGQTPVAVVVSGRPLLVSDVLIGRVPERLRERLRPMWMDAEKWWLEESILVALRAVDGSPDALRVSGKILKLQ